MDAHAWDERYAASDLVWSADPNTFVAVECADLPPGRALDLAAGEGRHALWLAARGWRVTALDFSAVGLDKGRRVAASLSPEVARSVDWVHADATTWHPSAGAAYDLALLAYLQLPPAQRRTAVHAAYDALAPSGTLLVVAHDRTNLTEGVGGPQDPEVLMSAQDVLDDLAAPPGRPHTVLRAERAARVVEPGHGADDSVQSPGRTAWDCVVRVVRP